MKVVSLCVCIAAVSAVPRISLNLANHNEAVGVIDATDASESPLTLSALDTEFVSTSNNAFSADGNRGSYTMGGKGQLFKHTRFTSLAGENHNGAIVTAHRDLTLRCPAGASLTSANCTLPVPEAHDHHDMDINVVARVYHVRDNDGQVIHALVRTCSEANSDTNCAASAIEYFERGSYLIKYDATDDSGNNADQLVLMLTLDDTQKPDILFGTCPENQPITAGPAADLVCVDDAATDNVDNDVSDLIRYTVKYVCESDSESLCAETGYETIDNMCSEAPNGKCDQTELKTRIIGSKVGRFTITVHAWDKAGGYGHEGKDNYEHATRYVTITDGTAPTITLRKTYDNGVPEDARDYTKCDRTLTTTNNEMPDATQGNQCCDDGEDGESCQSVVQQCGYEYQDLRATAVDALDQYCTTLGTRNDTNQYRWCKHQKSHWTSYEWISGQIYNNVDDSLVSSDLIDLQPAMVTGQYTVRYNENDNNNQPATPVLRFVTVKDTQKPAISLHRSSETTITHLASASNLAVFNDQDYSAGQHNEMDGTDPGVWCQDTCDTDQTKLVISSTWTKFENAHHTETCAFGSDDANCQFDDQLVGKYTRTYRCTDTSGNYATVTRTFENVDGDKPVIEPQEDQNDNCVDVDGDPLNIRCEANMDGTFTMTTFECKDFHKNYHKKDDTDGEDYLPQTDITITADPSSDVNLEGTQVPDLRAPGRYFVNYNCQDEETTTGSRNAADQVQVVVTVVDSTKPVMTINRCNDNFGDAEISLQSCTNNWEAGFPYVDPGVTVTDTMAVKNVGLGEELSTEQCSQRVCELPAVGETSAVTCPCPFPCQEVLVSAAFVQQAGTSGPEADTDGEDALVAKEVLKRPQVGNYEITYNVKDYEQREHGGGNIPATTVTRKLVVRDTLQPVISLHREGHDPNPFHVSASGANTNRGTFPNPTNDLPASNPAGAAQALALDGVSNGNPNLGLMAEGEPTRVNAWAMAGVASAVAGVALLAAGKKHEVATAVPV